MPANISHLLDGCTDVSRFYKREGVALSTAVDSLKIRIPAKYVNIKCPELLDSEILNVNSSTGRVVGTNGQNKRTYEYPTEVRTPYSHEKFNVAKGRNPETFVTVGLSSKLLKGKYFEGLTIDNVDLLHNELLKQRIIECSLPTFLENSVCTDVDIKRDIEFQQGIEAFKKTLTELKKSTHKTNVKGKGARLFLEQGNLGIEFSDRRSTAFKTAPYLKLYHKGQELLTRSEKFAKAHLDKLDYSNIVRMEATIKNKKHFRSLYGDHFDGATLKAVLSLSEREKQRVFDDAFAAHVDAKRIAREREMQIGIPEDILKGQDKMIYRLMQMLIQDGKQFDSIVSEILAMYQGTENRMQRNRYKKKLCKFYDLMTRENSNDFCPILNMFLN